MSKVELPSAEGANEIHVSLCGETKIATTADEAMAAVRELCTRHGTSSGLAFVYFRTDTDEDDASAVVASAATEPAPVDLAKSCAKCRGPIAAPELAGDEPELCEVCAVAPAPAPVFSSFDGEIVTDDAAKSRIEAVHDKLRAAGVAVDTKEQLYGTGTRMAESGYATQEERKREHDAGKPVSDVVHELTSRVRSEKRADRIVSAREIAANIAVNGKLRIFGLAIGEHGIRGLLQRLDSPSVGYVIGLRKRIAESLMLARSESGEVVPCACGTSVDGKHFMGCAIVSDRVQPDKAKIAEVLEYECRRAGDVQVKLRTREADECKDIFAVVGPSYAAADAPEALAGLADRLPGDAKATYTYDPGSTRWELRADVWTPTPVADQAVGEPFRGYASFQSKDNGTGRLRGGGGIELLRCLNASTYLADGASIARVHRGRVLEDVGAMVSQAVTSIDALCDAWGKARAEEIAVPDGIPIGEAIPGFWRWLLTDTRSELAAVLPGRKEDRVLQMTRAYAEERRDPDRIVRADFAQAWTRAIQDEPADVRRDAEAAAGSFAMRGRVGYLEAKS